uniref:Uncharacterized protein n=1 Tax=Oryza brachyantha TaxID=4533 RepID=J3M053_ORYBR
MPSHNHCDVISHDNVNGPTEIIIVDATEIIRGNSKLSDFFCQKSLDASNPPATCFASCEGSSNAAKKRRTLASKLTRPWPCGGEAREQGNQAAAASQHADTRAGDLGHPNDARRRAVPAAGPPGRQAAAAGGMHHDAAGAAAVAGEMEPRSDAAHRQPHGVKVAHARAPTSGGGARAFCAGGALR